LIQAYEVIPYAKLGQRKQRVVINNSTSSWRDINAGVPQGSILGSLLFIVFINDILTDINSTIKLFVDDTSLYLIVDDPQETAQTLNDDLVKEVELLITTRCFLSDK
jgi:hypothetical protein